MALSLVPLLLSIPSAALIPTPVGEGPRLALRVFWMVLAGISG